MTSYPWRYRCPEGHASIRLYRDCYNCRTCRETYPKDELVDLAPTA